MLHCSLARSRSGHLIDLIDLIDLELNLVQHELSNDGKACTLTVLSTLKQGPSRNIANQTPTTSNINLVLITV